MPFPASRGHLPSLARGPFLVSLPTLLLPSRFLLLTLVLLPSCDKDACDHIDPSQDDLPSP